MRERTRYRISGSIFLLALAAIFVPIIFDGTSKEVSAIPPRPSVQAIEPVQDFAEVVPTSTLVEEVRELAGTVDEFGFSTESNEKFGEPRLSAPNEQTELWAVQAGSFSQQANATALRSTLRDRTYEAFISTVLQGGADSPTPIYRVAVGPLQDRADAERIRAEISAQFDVAATIVEMTP